MYDFVHEMSQKCGNGGCILANWEIFQTDLCVLQNILFKNIFKHIIQTVLLPPLWSSSLLWWWR